MPKVEDPFTFVDYSIFALVIVISLGIGIYHALSGGRQRTTSEYFVGNRKMLLLPVAFSLMVSFESSIMMLGTPAEVYVYGFQWMIGNLGYLIADILSAFIMAPLMHPLKITSIYEYLELRFESHAVRILGTILGIITTVTYMGIVLFGPAIAVEAVLGIPLWISIVSIALASVIYTSIGGFKAVIWTDVFQGVIMLVGMFALIIKGTMKVGGVKKTWTIANDNERINMFNFDPDPTVRHTFWNLFFGYMLRAFGLAFGQSAMQRVGAMETVSQAKKVLLLTAPGHFLVLSLAAIQGIVAYAYFDTIGCDPIAADEVTDPNQLMPYMVVDIFQDLQGMSGIFMASLFCASLSTLSSGLNSMSALFWTDIVKPHTQPMSEFRATLISKLSVILFGTVSVLIAFVISLIGGTLIQISGSILSTFGGPLTGLFLFGVFCPWGNAKGAFISTSISAVVTLTVCIGQTTVKGAVKPTMLPDGPINTCDLGVPSSTSLPWTTTSLVTNWTSESVSMEVSEPSGFSRLFMISYAWFATLGILQVLVLGTVISFLTGYKKIGEVDKKYLLSPVDFFLPYLPECMRRFLRCGYFKTDRENQESLKFQISEYGSIDTYFRPDTDTKRLLPSRNGGKPESSH